MDLIKQIPELKLQDEYKPLVEDMKELTLKMFPNDIHSIYMCGSIPKGKGLPYVSDVDFTVVFNDDVMSYYLETIEHIKHVIHKKYPLVTKVDIAVCSKADVLRKPKEWGFWVKIISVCIHGYDLSAVLPEISGDKELIIALNRETLHVASMLIDKLRIEDDEKEILRLRRALTKRLIRALFTLVIDKVGYWSDDFDEIQDLLYLHFPKEEKRIRALYFFLENEESGLTEYLTTVYGIEKYIRECLNQL